MVTEFGISKRFDLDTSHDTNENQLYDPKYVSLKIYNNTPRGDPSDVFSLGCLFLEMATLLLGKKLKDLDKHYLPKHSDPVLEDLGKDYATK